MSVVAGYQTAGSTQQECVVTVKGAPETLQNMVSLKFRWDTLYCNSIQITGQVVFKTWFTATQVSLYTWYDTV